MGGGGGTRQGRTGERKPVAAAAAAAATATAVAVATTAAFSTIATATADLLSPSRGRPQPPRAQPAGEGAWSAKRGSREEPAATQALSFRARAPQL